MSSKRVNILIAVVVAFSLVGAAVYFSGIGGHGWLGGLAGVFFGNEISNPRLDAGGDPFLGRSDAKVKIIEFLDYQCPSCLLFHFGAGDAIMNEYVKKGLALVVYKDFPILGDDSLYAAYAAACANEQGKFFEYSDYLFSQQSKNTENSGLFSFSNLTRFAEETGLDKKVLSDCLGSEKYKNDILEDIEDGKAAGVTGAPTVFINGRKMEGLLLFESYKKVIEEELKK